MKIEYARPVQAGVVSLMAVGDPIDTERIDFARYAKWSLGAVLIGRFVFGSKKTFRLAALGAGAAYFIK